MGLIEIDDQSLSTLEVKGLLATDHPMVKEFRFEKTQETKGKRICFALKIIPKSGVRYQQQRDSSGRRINPQWKTLTGSERIGQGNRVIWMEEGKLVAENATFFPNQEFNDLGIGSALYVSMERMYRALGICRVTLLAVDIGVYVWARQGFAFNEPGMLEQITGPFKQFLQQHGYTECADLQLRNSWDFANFNIPGVNPDGYRAGKYYMLNHISGWYGIKYLDNEVLK